MSKQSQSGRMNLAVIIDDETKYVKSLNEKGSILETTSKFSERLTLPEKGSGDFFHLLKVNNKDKRVILNKEWETITIKI